MEKMIKNTRSNSKPTKRQESSSLSRLEQAPKSSDTESLDEDMGLFQSKQKVSTPSNSGLHSLQELQEIQKPQEAGVSASSNGNSAKLVSAVNTDILEEKINHMASLERFSKDDRAFIKKLVQSIDVEDSYSVMNYAAAPQRKLLEYLEPMLKGLENQDFGISNGIVTELSKKMSSLNLTAVKSELERGVWYWATKIPVFGKRFSHLRKLYRNQPQIIQQLNLIHDRANSSLLKLRGVSEDMDNLMKATEKNLRVLELYIVAGEQAILEMNEEYDIGLQKAQATRDHVAIGRLSNIKEQIKSFETRILYLQVAFQEGLLSIPEIRAVQESSKIASRDTMNTLLVHLPAIHKALIRIKAQNQINTISGSNQDSKKLYHNVRALGTSMLEQTYSSTNRSEISNLEEIDTLVDASEKIVQLMSKTQNKNKDNTVKLVNAKQRVESIKQKVLPFVEDGSSSAEVR